MHKYYKKNLIHLAGAPPLAYRFLEKNYNIFCIHLSSVDSSLYARVISVKSQLSTSLEHSSRSQDLYSSSCSVFWSGRDLLNIKILARNITPTIPRPVCLSPVILSSLPPFPPPPSKLMILPCSLTLPLSLKGTVPQNIFFLKSGHIGCIDL